MKIMVELIQMRKMMETMNGDGQTICFLQSILD
jgi:hypothetical protein